MYFEKAASSSYCSFAQVPSADPLLSAEAFCGCSWSQHRSQSPQVVLYSPVLHPPSPQRCAEASKKHVGGQESRAGPRGKAALNHPALCLSHDEAKGTWNEQGGPT